MLRIYATNMPTNYISWILNETQKIILPIIKEAKDNEKSKESDFLSNIYNEVKKDYDNCRQTDQPMQIINVDCLSTIIESLRRYTDENNDALYIQRCLHHVYILRHFSYTKLGERMFGESSKIYDI